MAKGRKTGGRQLGTPNRRTAAQVAAIEASGETPLAYLLNLMRDESQDLDVRVEAARAALPFCHARLATVEVSADVQVRRDISAKPMSIEEWEAAYSEAH